VYGTTALALANVPLQLDAEYNELAPEEGQVSTAGTTALVAYLEGTLLTIVNVGGVCSSMHAVESGMHAVESGMHAVESGMHAMESGGMHAMQSEISQQRQTPNDIDSIACTCTVSQHTHRSARHARLISTLHARLMPCVLRLACGAL